MRTDDELRKKIDTVYKYWNSRLEKCNLKEASLKRQLIELNANTADWEECYQLLMNVQDERESISGSRYVLKADLCRAEKYASFSSDIETVEERLARRGLLEWLEKRYDEIVKS